MSSGKSEKEVSGSSQSMGIDTSSKVVSGSNHMEEGNIESIPETARGECESITTAAVGLDKVIGGTRREKQTWTAKEDEALMIAVLEERKARAEREAERNGNDEGNEEDWDAIEWDVIAESVPDRSEVECLKRYLRHKKTHDFAKAASQTTSEVPSLGESPTSASLASPQQKRNIASTVTESEEMNLSMKRPKRECTWSIDDIELLQSLVEQYQDSE